MAVAPEHEELPLRILSREDAMLWLGERYPELARQLKAGRFLAKQGTQEVILSAAAIGRDPDIFDRRIRAVYAIQWLMENE